jgi:hypothetical protein
MSNSSVPVAAEEQNVELEASVDTVLALCEGDTRTALRSLLVANDYLNSEVERLQTLISRGYARRV